MTFDPEGVKGESKVGESTPGRGKSKMDVCLVCSGKSKKTCEARMECIWCKSTK